MPVPARPSGPPPAVAPMPSVSAVTRRTIRRVLGYLALRESVFGPRHPQPSPLDRYRAAHVEVTDETDPDLGMCRRGCGNPAAYNNECFACLSNRRLPA